MIPASPRRVALSSWAVHRWLGYEMKDSPVEVFATNHVDASRLLSLPQMAKQHNISTLEICHFHLPRFDTEFLNKFIHAAKLEGVQLFSLLIDDGDLSHPKHHLRDRDWIEAWMAVAAQIGFMRVRVIAGRQAPTPEALRRSQNNLEYLGDVAAKLNLRLTTENWLELFSQPEPLLETFEQLKNKLGLCLDFGNWHGEMRHKNLAAIAHLAESCHAKCEFDANGHPDLQEFNTCLELVNAVGFSGPFTLVHGLEPDEWGSLKVQQQALKEYL